MMNGNAVVTIAAGEAEATSAIVVYRRKRLHVSAG